MEVKSTLSPHLQSSPALAGARQNPFKWRTPLEEWARVDDRKRRNKQQERYLLRIAKSAANVDDLSISLKAAASLHFCNKRQIVQKIGENYKQVGTFYCGKKYCSHCANRKRRKLLAIFQQFFQKSERGKEILEKYDLALFTVTLQHSKSGKRKDPYYKELSEHWRNALKYGSFKKYIAGGFYNTEHTYGKNGHHIHRHALVLIPIGEHSRVRFLQIESELREQWKSRTGGSFQINLTPFGAEKDEKGNIIYVPTREELIKNFGKHLLEVTKYITKRDEDGTVQWEIIKAVAQNCRAKFYGRFGILHREKELLMNSEIWELRIDEKIIKKSANKKALEKYAESKGLKNFTITNNNDETEIEKGAGRELYTGTAVVMRDRRKLKKGEKRAPVSYHFNNLRRIEDKPEELGRFADANRWSLYEWGQKMWSNYREGYDVKKYLEKRAALKRWNTPAAITPNTNFITPLHLVQVENLANYSPF